MDTDGHRWEGMLRATTGDERLSAGEPFSGAACGPLRLNANEDMPSASSPGATGCSSASAHDWYHFELQTAESTTKNTKGTKGDEKLRIWISACKLDPLDRGRSAWPTRVVSCVG